MSAPGPQRRESEIQKAILDLLHARGVVCWKAGSGGFRSSYKGRERFVQMGRKGVADIIGVLPPSGRLLAVEVKAEGKLPTDVQAAFLHSVRQAGGLALVAHSVDELAVLMGWRTP